MIHTDHAVERARGVACFAVANHGSPSHCASELAVQHAQNVLLVAAGEGDAREEVVVFVIRVAAKLFLEGLVRDQVTRGGIWVSETKRRAFQVRQLLVRAVGFYHHDRVVTARFVGVINSNTYQIDGFRVI